jgi:hypothetical protein
MQSSTIDPDLRRRNLRTAWLLAGIAVFIAASSIPFWKGLFQMAMATAR